MTQSLVGWLVGRLVGRLVGWLVGWLVGNVSNVGRTSRRNPEKYIYSPCNSRRESSCFTRQTTSHPAHTSNLGKVSKVSYRLTPIELSGLSRS